MLINFNITIYLFWKGLNLTVEFTGGTNINISIVKTQIKDLRNIRNSY